MSFWESYLQAQRKKIADKATARAAYDGARCTDCDAKVTGPRGGRGGVRLCHECAEGRRRKCAAKYKRKRA